MGGMIAQVIASNYPHRALSLTAIMSSTGNPGLPKAAPEIMEISLIPRAAGEDIAASIANARLLIIEGMGHDLPAPAR